MELYLHYERSKQPSLKPPSLHLFPTLNSSNLCAPTLLFDQMMRYSYRLRTALVASNLWTKTCKIHPSNLHKTNPSAHLQDLLKSFGFHFTTS